MAKEGFKIFIENEKDFQKAVLDAIKHLDSLKTPFKLIASDFYKSEKAIFNLKSAGAYDDFKDDKTKQAKIRAVGFAYPLLLRTGALMRSVTSPSADGSILNIRDKSMELGTNLKSKGKNG